VAGLAVDVPGLTGVDEERSPAGSDVVGMLIAAERIIATRDRDRREWQWISWIRAECHQVLWPYRGIGDIGRCNEECPCHLVAEMGNGVDGGRNAKRMRDQSYWSRRSVHLFGDALYPIVADRLRPFGLFDTASGAELGLPAALPMVGTGIRITGDDEDFGV